MDFGQNNYFSLKSVFLPFISPADGLVMFKMIFFRENHFIVERKRFFFDFCSFRKTLRQRVFGNAFLSRKAMISQNKIERFIQL